MKFTKTQICSFIVVLFHVVGFFGFTTSFSELFKQLVPLHLLLMLGLIVASHPRKDKNFLYFLVLVYLAGYAVEWVGVHTGLIFGDYFYEATLGYKAFEVPLLIGVNWVLVIYSVGMSVSLLKINNAPVKAAIGAAMVTLLDYFIEPVAIKYDYWQWQHAYVPPQNYVAWFFVSFLMLIFFYKMNLRKDNTTGTVLFIAQMCFFIALNFKIN